MRGRSVNQDRAIKYYMSLHPELKLAMGVAGISIGFTDRVTGKTEQVALATMESLYNHQVKEKDKKVKSMKKELKENGHTIKSKPSAIRPSRGRTQVSLTGDDSTEGEA